MNQSEREKFYNELGRPTGTFSLQRRWQDVLHDKKWKKLLKISQPFIHLPFVDFIVAAGSLALGSVHKNSDFDVIVGCRFGRIFTARFFCILIFGVLGRRREKLSHREAASDKICFNHFVTEKSYRLSPPHNIYWQELYRNLVPVFGQPELVSKFFKANDWLEAPVNYLGDLRHLRQTPSFFKKALENFLGGRFGDLVERILKNIQIKRIEKSLKHDQVGFAPRIKYTDEELEFHPDTSRIARLISGE